MEKDCSKKNYYLMNQGDYKIMVNEDFKEVNDEYDFCDIEDKPFLRYDSDNFFNSEIYQNEEWINILNADNEIFKMVFRFHEREIEKSNNEELLEKEEFIDMAKSILIILLLPIWFFYLILLYK